MLLDEWIEYRFDYGIKDKYHNELLAVFTAETDVRKALTEIQGQLSYESKEQARNFAGTQKNDYRELSETSYRDSGNIKGSTTESERSQENRGDQYQRQIDSNRAGEARTQVQLLDEFDRVVQRIMALNKENDQTSTQSKVSKADSANKRFSRHEPIESTHTETNIRDILTDHFSKNIIESLEQKGILTIIPTHSDKSVEGWYQDGRVTLVADQLNEATAVPNVDPRTWRPRWFSIDDV